MEPVPGGASLVPTSALEVQPPRSAYPVVPGRPELQTKPLGRLLIGDLLVGGLVDG